MKRQYLLSFLFLLCLAFAWMPIMQAGSAPAPAPIATVDPKLDPEASLPPHRDDNDIPYCEWAEGKETVLITHGSVKKG